MLLDISRITGLQLGLVIPAPVLSTVNVISSVVIIWLFTVHANQSPYMSTLQ